MSSILPPPPSSHLYPLPLCTSCPPLPPSPPFDKTMHGDSLAISKNPNPPFKYKASQCGESDPNTASQSDSSKDCTHSKGVNQLGAMSHSQPAPLFSGFCYFFLDVVIDVELFTLRANFLSTANFALFPLVNFVSSAGQLSLRQLFAPTWKCVDHCDTNTKRNKFFLVQIQIQLEAHWPHERGRTNQRISAAVRRH